MRNLLDTILAKVTPARVAAGVTYVFVTVYPGLDPNIRGGIVGAVTGLYVLGVAVVEHAERKHGSFPSSPRASSPRNTQRKDIR